MSTTLERPPPPRPTVVPDAAGGDPDRKPRGRRGWPTGRRLDLVLLGALLTVTATVHAVGMSTYPNWVDDPGTYLSQAWAVENLGELSPYAYFYDHAPGGWIQLALWSMATNGFGRHETAMAFGNEAMLIAAVVSTALVFLLARRLGLGRIWAGAAVLMFALSPLAVHYTRPTYLDNLATPWLLLAFFLAADRRGHLGAVAGSTVAFSVAVLTKETVLLTLPALVVALWATSHRATRAKAVVVAAAGGSLVLLYPAMALVKGELFPGPGHTSLLGTAVWQLHSRTPTGSLLDGSSATRSLVEGWAGLDPWLLGAALLAPVALVLVRSVRVPALVVLLQSVVLFTGGYVPFMHVINLLPWCALVAAGVGAELSRRLSAGRPRLRSAVEVALVAGLAVLVGPGWVRSDLHMMTVREEPELLLAERWVGDHVPRDDVLVVHDSLWTDLVQKQGFPRENVVVVSKIDADPAVNTRLDRVDYLVVPDYYYVSAEGGEQYPTAVEARRHGIAVARFGDDPDRAVTVYRVSDRWSPRG